MMAKYVVIKESAVKRALTLLRRWLDGEGEPSYRDDEYCKLPVYDCCGECRTGHVKDHVPGCLHQQTATFLARQGER